MRRKSFLWRAILFFACLGVVVWYSVSCRTQEQPANGEKKKPVPLVEVEPVKTDSIARMLDLTGEVIPGNAVIISSMKEGRIELCPWREGDDVVSGETLVTIDREVHRAEELAAQAVMKLAQAKLDDLLAGTRPEEIRRAEANLKRAEVTFREARQSFDRQSELFRQQSTSQDLVDKARERMEVAEAEMSAAMDTLVMLKAGPTLTEIAVQKAALSEANARLVLARAHLAECEITAPFDGIISRVHVRPGDMASSRAPLIEMFDSSSLVIRFAVPEAHAVAVRAGMNLQVSLDAMPGRSLSAEIVRVYPVMDPAMRTRTVEARITDHIDLAPHMFARVVLTVARAEKALVVPAEAILLSPTGQRMLYLIEEGKAVRRQVAIGIEQGARVQILSGVKSGDKVVVGGNEQLKPGMSVRIAQDQMGGRKPGDQPAQPEQAPGAKKGNQQ